MRNILSNKKGDEGNFKLIAGILLVLIVFGVLIYFFWDSIKSAIFSLNPTKVNVATIKDQCRNADNLGRIDEVCCVQRAAIFEDKSAAIDVTCSDPRIDTGNAYSAKCTGYVCQSSKCVNYVVDSTTTPKKTAVPCDTAKCSDDQQVKLSFSDVTTGQVCCKACTA